MIQYQCFIAYITDNDTDTDSKVENFEATMMASEINFSICRTCSNHYNNNVYYSIIVAGSSCFYIK